MFQSVKDRIESQIDRAWSAVDITIREISETAKHISIFDGEDKPALSKLRRKSIFSKTLDPEIVTSNAAEKKVVHPKSDEQWARLESQINDVFLLQNLDSDQRKEVIDALQGRDVDEGAVVIKQGDDGDYFYIIDSGSFEAVAVVLQPSTATKNTGPSSPSSADNIQESENTSPPAAEEAATTSPRASNDDGVDTTTGAKADHPVVKTVYENQGSFGELALLYNTPRTATVTATTKASLWVMDRDTFQRIVLLGAYRKRLLYEELLKSVPMLNTLTDYERLNVADALEGRTFEQGEVVIHQGDPADGMYFIHFGTLTVTVEHEQKGVCGKVDELGPGSYFGVLNTGAFERLLGPCLDLMKRNISLYDAQIRELFEPSPIRS